MDRIIVYDHEQIDASDVAYTNLFSMVGAAKIAKAILGSGPWLNDLTCVPTGPASLSVILNPGEIYKIENVDNSPFGPIAADTAHQILKTGILLNDTTFPLTPPSSPGQSIDYLIQATYSDSDTAAQNRPFFGASPQVVDTQRLGVLTASVKAGTPATTGTQTPPTPDAGYVGAWVITVDNGQTQITAPDIVAYTNAPFILEKLSDKISQTRADIRYAQAAQIQSGALIYAIDGGAANAYVASPNPALTGYTDGAEFNIQISNTNTGASTLNLSGLGTRPILNHDGSALLAGQIVAGRKYKFIYNSATSSFLINLTTDSFVRNIGINGYEYSAAGLTQYGIATLPATGISVSGIAVTLPIPYQTAIYNIQCTPKESVNTSGYHGMAIGSPISLTQLAVDIDTNLTASINKTVEVYWRTFGV